MLPFGVLLIAPPIALVGAVVFFAMLYANRSGRMAQIWRSNTTIWVGRSAVTVLFLASTNALVRDVSEVL
jgi:ABC-type enterochelin transport system permease subunit